VGKIDEKEAERMMELTTSWQEKGRKEGRIEGRVEGQANILVRQLKKKFNSMPAKMENQVRSLSAEKLQELAEAIFELEKLEDVQNFLR